MSITFRDNERVEEKEFMNDHGKLVEALIKVKQKEKEIEENYLAKLQEKEAELKKELYAIFDDYDVRKLETDNFKINMTDKTLDKETIDVSLLEKQDATLYNKLVQTYGKTVKGRKPTMTIVLKKQKNV